MATNSEICFKDVVGSRLCSCEFHFDTTIAYSTGTSGGSQVLRFQVLILIVAKMDWMHYCCLSHLSLLEGCTSDLTQ